MDLAGAGVWLYVEHRILRLTFGKAVLSLDAYGKVKGLLNYTVLPNVDSQTQPSNCKYIKKKKTVSY